MQTTAQGCAYFLSDMHLGAAYMGDTHACEQRLIRFFDSISHEATEIYLLGDVLDYWFEYRYVVPKGFVRFFGKLAELTDRGVRVVWLTGNHDIWLFGYLRQELGVEIIDSRMVCDILGEKFFLSHGDDVADPSRSFRMLRRLFRNRFCQLLYAAIHPRWTIPFALGWSRQSRKSGASMPRPDVAPLMRFAIRYSETNPQIRHYIFGHLHIEEQQSLPSGADLTVLGDWIHTYTYARFDGQNLTLHRYEE